MLGVPANKKTTNTDPYIPSAARQATAGNQVLFGLPPNVLIMPTPGHLPWELKAWFSCVVCVRLKTTPPKGNQWEQAGQLSRLLQRCRLSECQFLLVSFNVNYPCGGC